MPVTADRTCVRRRRAMLFVLALAVVGCALLGGTSSETVATAQSFTKFEHTAEMHARLPCLLCHRREDNSTTPRLPGHAPCAGCHAQQFADPASPVCGICHTNAQSGAMRPFPRLSSFNVKFDHATHTRGSARPRAGCVACHKSTAKGAALSIPARASGHATCYQCHTASATAGERDISSCGTCHAIGSYSRTPVNVRAFAVSFNHSRHLSKGLACAECHSVRPGAGQRRQVASPVAAQHNVPAGVSSCAKCHDGTRAFGGDNFAECKRCHTGDTWKF